MTKRRASGRGGVNPFKDFDTLVPKVLKGWSVPGVGIGVVYKGKTVYTNGYGLRDAERGLPFTAETRSVIGSCTKAMTATLLGILVDERKLEWDRPVVDYMPWFGLSDPVATQRVTARDLMSHRTGLPGHDRLWSGSPLTRRRLVERLRYLPMSKDIRTTFQYNGLTYITAALLIEEITGVVWEDFLRQKLLEPLAMDTHYFSVDQVQKCDNFAQPYLVRDGKAHRVPHYEHPQIAPAGPTCFSAADMCQWLIMQLGVGKFGRKQIISSDNIKQTHRPCSWPTGVIGYPKVCHQAYGMGWMIGECEGRHYINHGGGISGFTAFVSMLPNEQAGVVVLVNVGGSGVPGIINRSVYDRLLGWELVDRSAIAKREKRKAEASATKPKRPRRVVGTRPSHALSAYAGKYEHPGYGTLSIRRSGRGLVASYNATEGALKHWHYDVFEWPKCGPQLTFHMNREGQIASLSVPFEPLADEILFKR